MVLSAFVIRMLDVDVDVAIRMLDVACRPSSVVRISALSTKLAVGGGDRRSATTAIQAVACAYL